MSADKFHVFGERTETGRQLAKRLEHLHLQRPIVYTLPRGGVPVAADIAAALEAPLDLVLVRKTGAPSQPELAVGAVVDGDAAEMALNADIASSTGASEAYIAAARNRELAETERRRQLYLPGRPRPNPRGRDAIVVDDGLAAGATARATLHAVRRRRPSHLILAVPVAPTDTAAALQNEADQVVCLREVEIFRSIRGFYRDFHQLTDGEVIHLLNEATRHARENGNHSMPSAPRRAWRPWQNLHAFMQTARPGLRALTSLGSC